MTEAAIASRQLFSNLHGEHVASPKPPNNLAMVHSDVRQVRKEPEEATSDSDGLDNLSQVESGVLRELREEELLKVVSLMKSGQPLDHALNAVAKPTVLRVRRAVEDQYTTSDKPMITLEEDEEMDGLINTFVGSGIHPTQSCEDIERMARVTPLRLAFDERVLLRLLESTLEVSEYTDKVDVLDRSTPAKRMAHEIKHICAVLSGLVVAHHYDMGQQLIKEKDFKANAAFFRNVFEIGRRYKILNPERMRESYGKLVYFLMDARRPDVADVLQFDCVEPVKTVAWLLSKKKNGEALLRDPLLRVATEEIIALGKSRERVQREIRRKEGAVKALVEKYSTTLRKGTGLFGLHLRWPLSTASYWNKPEEESDDLAPEEIEQCLYSLCDHNTFLRFNREPVDTMILYLKKYFRPDRYEQGFSLAISCGREGARLEHSHERQYAYVLQSLTLWADVLHEMLGLWALAERDLLDCHNPYRLRDTGQGLNRVQGAPSVYRCMSRILSNVQQKVGGWCGSSVIHLGDHNVPNALMFIDKYIQVPRILGPVVLCLEKVPDLYKSTPGMKKYLDGCFGGPANLQKLILVDFFRHAFDGSGADNFYDAGSCIDGRLTSAWNWCAQIEKKSYFPVFLLTGFCGFDGRF